MKVLGQLLIAMSIVGGNSLATGEDAIRISSALLKVVEEIEVAAAKQGLLAAVHARPGMSIEKGKIIAQLSDTEARIKADRAKLEMEIASQTAGNDVNIRYARKSLAVAEAELKRALESVQRYPKSVSRTELDRLKLVAERAELQVEQAVHEAEIAMLTQKVKENELRLATEEVKQRQITAPVDGIVVDLMRHAGEWVEPGDPVFRLVRIDRLRAEGFLDAQHAVDHLTGAPVRLVVRQGNRQVEFPGKIVFVSPEIDPVNGQARIWAEIENPEKRLRAGMRGDLLIGNKR